MKLITFLLLPEFPLYGLVPAIESLSIANQYSQTPRLRVELTLR